MKRIVLALVAVVAVRAACRDDAAEIRFATFNIEDFPKNRRQIDGAFDEILKTKASFIALQEIGDPEVVEAEAHRRLGASWQFVHEPRPARGDYHPHLIGVLYDTNRWTLDSWQLHDETRLGNNKPVLEVRLLQHGEAVRVFVVHLRSGTPGRAVREHQHAALARVIARAVQTGDRVVVLGDFNATEDADRGDLRALAQRTGLTWATEALLCSAFWARDDGCPRSRLDHVLVWGAPDRVEALGACATEGCDWQASCPLYREVVSDHCPVVVTF